MKTVKDELLEYLAIKVAENLGKGFQVELTASKEPSNGEYSTNIALLAKGSERTPLESAKFLKELIELDKPEYLERVEMAGPGFLNFFISSEYLSRYIQELLNSSEKLDLTTKSHKTDKEKRQKIVLEFGDPNPFKELHIGHLRNLALGESYARLLASSGHEVIRANYEGDVGLHVAKAMWGIEKLGGLDDSLDEAKRAKFLGEAYTKGAKAYEDDEAAKGEIEAINKQIYSMDPEIQATWKKGREWSLESFEEIYKRLGIKYDHYYFESETAPVGLELVRKNMGKVFEEDQEAVIFRGSHTRVFITKEGNPTYEAKDLGLATLKERDYGPDRSIIMTANEQKEYFKVIFEALTKINPELGAKTTHASFGFVYLQEGKMSSREGKIISGEWLLDEAKTRLKTAFPETSEAVLDQIAVGCVKYSMLKFSRESDIKFSFDESINLGGNSGAYIQYTYARIQSLTGGKRGKLSAGKLESEEKDLLRYLLYFFDVVSEASENFSPNLLTNYLYDLASKFNLFYQKHKVIGSDQEESRLALSSATGKVIKEGLYLLGIEAPEKI